MDRLTIERRGGIAGMKALAVLELSGLDPADVAGVEALFAMKGRDMRPRGADRFSYHLVLEQRGKARSLTVPDHLFPTTLARLVQMQFPTTLSP